MVLVLPSLHWKIIDIANSSGNIVVLKQRRIILYFMTNFTIRDLNSARRKFINTHHRPSRYWNKSD